jgi:putative endonuclease
MYFVYILKCSDNSFYCGIAKDLDSRLKVHQTGKGSKYVFSRLPFTLVYSEKLDTKSLALKRELEIKSWSREQKVRNLKLLLK